MTKFQSNITETNQNIFEDKTRENTRVSKTIDEIKQIFMNKHINQMEETQYLIDEYKATASKRNNWLVLLGRREKELKTLTNNAEDIIDTVYTNHRRVEYQTPELAKLRKIRTYLIFVYYVFLSFYVFKRELFSFGFDFDDVREEMRNLIFVIILALLPMLLNNIIVFGYTIVDKLAFFMKNKAPKNVYQKI